MVAMVRKGLRETNPTVQGSQSKELYGTELLSIAWTQTSAMSGIKEISPLL